MVYIDIFFFVNVKLWRFVLKVIFVLLSLYHCLQTFLSAPFCSLCNQGCQRNSVSLCKGTKRYSACSEFLDSIPVYCSTKSLYFYPLKVDSAVGVIVSCTWNSGVLETRYFFVPGAYLKLKTLTLLVFFYYKEFFQYFQVSFHKGNVCFPVVKVFLG